MTHLVEALNSSASTWWTWIVPAFWQAAAVALLLLVVVAFVKRWSSPVRYALLLIALLKFAIPPLWSSPTGLLSHVGPVQAASSLTPRTQDTETPVAQARVDSSVSPTLKVPAGELQANDTVDLTPALSFDEPYQSKAEIFVPPIPRERIPASEPTSFAFPSDSGRMTPDVTWKAWLLVLHVMGSIAVLLVIVRQLAQLRSLVRSSSAPSERVLRKAEELRTQLQMRRPARLLISEPADSPIAFGVFRPTIILPHEEYSDSDLATVLGHELAHLSRWDGWISWLQLGLMSAWWFHPVFWILNRSIRRVREDCCDDLLIATGLTTTNDYCDTLLRVAARPSTAPAHVACSMSGRLHPLGDRIRRIMDPRVRRAVKLSLLNLTAVVVIAGLLLPGLRTEATQAQERSDETTAAPQKDFEIRKDLPVAKQDVDRFGHIEFATTVRPLTVGGRCVDTDGKPVANAKVRLMIPGPNAARYLDENGTSQTLEPIVATVQSDEDGRFEIKADKFPYKEFKPEPIAKPQEASFVVIGAADGLGLSCPGEKTLRLSKRPDALDPDEKRTLFFEGEPINVQLVFRPEVRVHGVVKDDLGQPLTGATVQLGLVRASRSPWGQEARTYRYRIVGEDGKEQSPGWELRYLPAKYRTATTNEKGEYEILGLPANSNAMMAAFITPNFQYHAGTVVSSQGESKRSRKYVGSNGEYDITLIRPRTVSVTLTSKNEPKPRCQVRFEQLNQRRTMYLGPGAIGVSENGVAKLEVPPGKYRVFVEPFGDQKLLPSEHELEVGTDLEQAISYTVPQGASVAIRAVAGDSNKPVPGIMFSWHPKQDASKVRPLHTQLGFVDHPQTDARGLLTATLPPGTHVIKTEASPGGKSETETYEVTLAEGAQRVLRIALPAIQGPPEPPVDEQLAELVEKWEQQQNALRRSRFVFRRANFLKGKLVTAEVQMVLQELVGKEPAHAEAILKHVFPHLKLSYRAVNLFDHHRMAAGSSWGDGVVPWEGIMISDLNIRNGRELLRYSAVNSQLDIENAQKSNMHIGSLSELVTVPRFRALPNTEATIDETTTTYDMSQAGQEQRIRFETQTGFLREMTSIRNGSGRIVRQYAPVNHDNGAITPAFRIEARIRNNMLERADVVFIDEAKMVTKFPAGTFSMSAPAGTNVLDYRGVDRNQVGARAAAGVTRAPVTDVVAYADARRARSEAAKKKPAQPTLKIGDKSPPLDVAEWYDQNGKTTAPNLDSKVVIINFHGRDLSGHVDENRTLREAYEVLNQRGVQVVNVYSHKTDPAKAMEFMKQYKLPWKLAIDKPSATKYSPGKTFDAFRCRGTTTTVILDGNGNISRSMRHTTRTRDAIKLALQLAPNP